MLAHRITPLKFRAVAMLGRHGIDEVITHAETQRTFAIDHLRFSQDHVKVLPYQVDEDFWAPRSASADKSLISSAGLEQRDYGTLLQAVTNIDIDVSIAAASPTSSFPSTLGRQHLSERIHVAQLNYLDLRELYAASRFVVVPLFDADGPAGITTILEAMAMGKAVIVTRSLGQMGAVVGPLWTGGVGTWPEEGPSPENASGIYVRPGDVGGLRSAIAFLLAHSEIAALLGANGRRLVEERYTIGAFVNRFAAVISDANLVDRPN